MSTKGDIIIGAQQRKMQFRYNWAERLGDENAARLLQQTLEEEQEADPVLS